MYNATLGKKVPMELECATDVNFSYLPIEVNGFPAFSGLFLCNRRV